MTTTDTEGVADRLLRSTAARAYDPDVDIDWSAPLAPDKAYVLPHRCSLYGTSLYDQLSAEQRIELGKHEAVSVASTGIFLEAVLMRMLARVAYTRDPLSQHVQYALAELGEETRHTIMFAKMIDRLGTPCYLPPLPIRWLGGLLSAVAHGPSLWGAILIGEEVIDRLQREIVDDESIQPLIRMICRIHITEEARHVGFARTELLASVARTPRYELPYHRLTLARTAFILSRIMINPRVYRAVGLDPQMAKRVALANPYHRETLRYGGEKLVSFLDKSGLIGRPGSRLWRRSFLAG
ncbi:MAG TPA: diiron oxygenase [Streptosporangiaceae bacterium]|nr:diiron oxygenase [Streptosporangiaceae bacterium]